MVMDTFVTSGNGGAGGGTTWTGGGEFVVICAPGIAAAARTADHALTRPLPNKGSMPATPVSSAVSSSSEAIWSLDKVGLTDATSATTAATIGLEKDVPRHEPYGFEGSRCKVQILSPG